MLFTVFKGYNKCQSNCDHDSLFYQYMYTCNIYKHYFLDKECPEHPAGSSLSAIMTPSSTSVRICMAKTLAGMLAAIDLLIQDYHILGPNIHRLETDIQVNVYIGNTLSRLSFQN